MKKKILIFGSGSIGTHHANAAVSLNYNVFITDKEENQLINMSENIYPSRYKKWNEQIKCLPYKSVFNLSHILVFNPLRFTSKYLCYFF